MGKDYSTIPPNQIRNAGRAVEDEAWIRGFLRRMPVGVLATVYDGQPFATTQLYVYDEPAHAIYMHTAQVGRTRANVEHEERVCFTVSEIGRLLPYRHPIDFDVEYASVVVFGRAHMVSDLGEKRRILEMLLKKYTPHLEEGKDYEPIPDEDLKRTSVYHIQIEQWSGKKNAAEADFPGAFEYKIPE